MKYEISNGIRKAIFEESDYQRKLDRRLRREKDSERGGILICTERGKCYSKIEPLPDKPNDSK